MRKQKLSALVFITIVFAGFTLGFFLGRNPRQEEIVVRVSNQSRVPPSSIPLIETESTEATEEICFPIHINHAGKEEFMALPGIGEVLAQRILDYRTENGAFGSVEELLNVEGIGKKRLEEIIDLITIGG